MQGEVSKIVANSFNRKYIEIVFQDGQRGYYPTSLAADEMKYADSDGGKHCFYPENPVEFWKNAKQKEALRIEQKRIREEKSQAIKEARAKLPGAKIGMTKKQVIEKTSWGEPDKINRTVTKAGEEEQWVYGDGNYLYFTNGKLTAMQN